MFDRPFDQDDEDWEYPDPPEFAQEARERLVKGGFPPIWDETPARSLNSVFDEIVCNTWNAGERWKLRDEWNAGQRFIQGE